MREWAAKLGGEAAKAVEVNTMGKYKTASQMLALVLLLAVQQPSPLGSLVATATDVGVGLLSVAAILSAASLATYMRAMWRYL